MKVINLKCLSCGANMQVSDDKTEAVCPYCGYKFLLDKEPDIDELSEREEKLSYARKTGERKAIEDSIDRKNQRRKRKIKMSIISIIGLLIVIISAPIFTYFSLEYIEDPFECISVEFVGIDGYGETKIIDNKKCEYFDDITFSKLNLLEENQKIEISAISGKYRFGVKSKEYIVKGLSLYLNNLDDLTDEALIKLHNFSYNHLKNKSLGITFYGEVVSLVPYKLYLYTNNSNKNILYDVYKISIKTSSGNIYEKYVVAYYEKFVLLDSSELFSYSNLYHCGNVIQVGKIGNLSDYAGVINGYDSIIDFESYLNGNNDGTFEIKERSE